MSRTWEDDCLILRMYPIGEIHSGVYLLSREHGLVQTVAHGTRSARGSMRSVCQVLNSGRGFIYTDPVKQSSKLKEFSLVDDRQAIKSCLSKYLHACVWLELLSKVVADGPWEYELAQLGLHALGLVREQDVWLATVQFFQRFLAYSGLNPDPDHDQVSGRNFGSDEYTRLSNVEGGFVGALEGPGSLGPGVRRYIQHTARLDFSQACTIGLEASQVRAYALALAELIQGQFQIRLSSWDMVYLGL